MKVSLNYSHARNEGTLGFSLPSICFTIAALMCLTNITFAQISHEQQNQAQLLDWLNGLYEHGVTIENDSLIINEESMRVLNDADYRKLIYPKSYNWEQAMRYVQSQELNKAFWYFINLYNVDKENKELVLKCLAAYDGIFKVDKMLISSFYTYCYMDPDVGNIVDGITNITAPNVLEEKLRTVKEIIYYLDDFRSKN